MLFNLPSRWHGRRSRLVSRLAIEALESRTLPSGSSWPGLLNPQTEAEPNDTLDQAQDLGDLSVSGRGEAVGSIATRTAGKADVDWYRFTLDHAAHVGLSTIPGQGSGQVVSVLGLYDSDPFDFNDPYNPIGNRLLAQDDGAAHGGTARLDQFLAAGTYYVAVSGSGNPHFHPYLADSGSGGSTGRYGLLLTAADLGYAPTDGPAVLTTDPAPGGVLDHSPLVIRVEVSAPLDPATALPGETVQLFLNGNGTFGDGNDQPVSLVSANLNAAANELLFLPASPLAPGYYRIVLSGNGSAGQTVLADPNGIPLGKSANHPSGQDFATTFQVAGMERNSGAGATADDTLATAHPLGELAGNHLVQVAGAIGDDPFYNFTSPDPSLNPANDVDLYHFHLTGPGRFAFLAETFAGRIGSPLDPALSLFQVGAAGQQLRLVAVNDNTLNDSQASNQTLPLYTDAALYAGLTQGDYYLAVSSSGNMPNPAAGLPPGRNGIFDPNVTHSGQAGTTTGDYVLNLLVQPGAGAPQVVAVTPSEGATLNAPPTHLTVQFSKPVNVQQLAYESQQTQQNNLGAVYIQAADGSKYYPRLEAYDQTANQATFLMLDGLANGAYQFHLSGPNGLGDLAGVPLARNDASGDYVAHFSVNGPARGTNGNPLLWSDQEPNDDFSHPQVLGPLFPHELSSGVKVVRDFTRASAPSDTADDYQFQVLQSRPYFFTLTGSGLPGNFPLTLADAAGRPIPTVPQGGGGTGLANLDPGTYVVRIGGWSPARASSVAYQLQITLGASVENPTPLTIGPAPAYRIALAFNGPAAPAAPASAPPAPPGSTSPTPTPTPAPSPQTTPPLAPTAAPPAPAPAPSGSTPASPPTSPPATTPAPTAPPPTTPSTPPTTPPPTTLPGPTVSQPPPSSAPATTPPATTPPAAAATTPTAASPTAPAVTPPSLPAPAVPTQQAPPAAPTPAPPATAPPSAPVPALPASPGSPATSSVAAPPGPSPSAPPVLSPAVPPPSAPASLPVSPPHVEISAPAETLNGAGILLIANYRLAGQGPSLGAIPADVLAGLSAVPVGGVRGADRSDAPPPAGRVPVLSTERLVRLTVLSEMLPEDEPSWEKDSAAPAGQSQLPSTPPSVFGPGGAAHPSGTDLATIIKSFASPFGGVWRNTLDDLFMTNRWPGRLAEWLDRLPRSPMPSHSVPQGTAPDHAADEQDGFEAALPDSTSNEPRKPGVGQWAYAGLMFGMGALAASGQKEKGKRKK